MVKTTRRHRANRPPITDQRRQKGGAIVALHELKGAHVHADGRALVAPSPFQATITSPIIRACLSSTTRDHWSQSEFGCAIIMCAPLSLLSNASSRRHHHCLTIVSQKAAADGWSPCSSSALVVLERPTQKGKQLTWTGIRLEFTEWGAPANDQFGPTMIGV